MILKINSQEILNNDCQDLPEYLATYIKQLGPIALVMGDFYQKLIYHSKQTPYPADVLLKLLRRYITTGVFYE